MKAIELAKVLYPALSKDDFIQQTCPDHLLIINEIECKKNKKYVDDECMNCWDMEISDKRAEWLIEAKKIRDLL